MAKEEDTSGNAFIAEKNRWENKQLSDSVHSTSGFLLPWEGAFHDRTPKVTIGGLLWCWKDYL